MHDMLKPDRDRRLEMDRRNFLLSGTVFVSVLTAPAQDKNAKLEVQVSYTGSGTVDESHKVYVVLWDNPNFVTEEAGAPPIELKGVSSKSASVQFDDVQTNPVYVSMVYDPSGKWDAASPPPSGSSLGFYATEPGKPAPVKLEAGKTAKIPATFDDSFKMK
jgi:hypothetical protein